MQNHQLYTIDENASSINPVKSYSPYEPEKKTKTIKRSVIGLLIVSIILVIALVLSIVLVFTIGLKAARGNNSQEENLPASPPYEPCACGCPSIEPIFTERTTATARVVNGETARPHSWPWQMLLLVVDEDQTPVSYCGATLFTDRHILTAAHCVHQYFPPFIFLFSGQHTFNLSVSLRSGHQVNGIYIHEGYNAYYQNDIAILTIEPPVRFDSFIQPICLPTPDSPVLQANEELVAIGWGRISGEPDTNISPLNLQQVKLAYVPTTNPNCSDLFQESVGVHPGQMCAGKPGYNVCQGDSGGPLMRRIRKPYTETYYWHQMGIASATIDCGWNSTWPDIYTNVPYYYNWIMATVKRTI